MALRLILIDASFSYSRTMLFMQGYWIFTDGINLNNPIVGLHRCLRTTLVGWLDPLLMAHLKSFSRLNRTYSFYLRNFHLSPVLMFFCNDSSGSAKPRDKLVLAGGGERHNTEVAFALLTQQRRVQISALPIFFKLKYQA